jgi:predicted amidohydrolase YtcJ
MDSRSYELFKEAAQAGELTTRIYAMIDANSDFYENWLAQGPAKHTFSDLLTVDSVKLFADGAIGSRGAAMLEPYQDDPDNRGFLFYDTDQLADTIQKAAEQGFQVNIHAIGDRANRTVIDAHEKVQNARSANLRHRIEHAQIIDPEDILRMRELGLVASVQPAHAMGDMGMVERRIGKHRMKGAYAWRRFLDKGVLMACGSGFSY